MKKKLYSIYLQQCIKKILYIYNSEFNIFVIYNSEVKYYL